MFETAELGQKVSKKEFKQKEPGLREELLTLQNALRSSAEFPVIILFAGVDGAGKSETVNLLNAWMDPRWIVTRAFGPPSDETRERPEYWRFWLNLPPKGRIGLLLSAWYSNPLLRQVYGESSGTEFERRLEDILDFEKTLADEGALILKFWMHLDKKAQKKRLKAFESDPLLKWRVTKKDWEHWKLYDKFTATAERIISRTSTGHAPWFIVEGWDHEYRSLRVVEVISELLRARLNGPEKPLPKVESKKAKSSVAKGDNPSPAEKPVAIAERKTVLSKLDTSHKLERKDYKRSLAQYQGQLNLLQRKAKNKNVSTILVFEGWDAGGKGGAIRRITSALDAREAQVIPIAAPTDEEKAHHYLWRFWRHLPRAGRITIFDRSWYGRVLVERVEGFATEEEWARAYAEINAFERQLVEHDIILLKFWLHISKEEQLRRFKAREETSFKRWKITDEDWRNREKWDEYETAVHAMVERTSTKARPWILVEGNDKKYARVKVLKTLCERLESSVK
jgi:polyphosphate:AMP phosphotransferase